MPLKNGQEGVFANGVKGNGMTLGLTDGTKNGGLWFSSAYALDASTTSYGTTVGTATINNPLTNSKDIGVTTDPSKSGMVVDKNSSLWLEPLLLRRRHIAECTTD